MRWAELLRAAVVFRSDLTATDDPDMQEPEL
jgi:hypothetical protein